MKQRLCKQNIISAIIVSISTAFTMLFFSPVDIMMRNTSDFPIGAEHIIIPMTLLSLTVAAAVFLLLFICILINQKLFNSIICIVFGIELASYIQVLFFNGGMVLLTENADAYAKRNLRNYTNFFIYYILLFLPIVLYYAKLTYKAKIYRLVTRKNLSIAAAIIMAMQTVGICSSIPNLHKVEDSHYVKYLSYEPLTSLSQEKNIIVFLPDRFDAHYMKVIEERYPEIYDKFDGFTFYSGNVSRYCNTFPAVANLLTGYEYNNESQYAYLRKAWQDTNPLDQLKDNGFKTNYILEAGYSYNTIANLYSHCDNVKNADCGYTLNYFKDTGILNIMTLMAFSKTLPYFMKPLASERIPGDFGDYFVELNEEPDDRMRFDVNATTDLRFYDYITAHNISADCDSKVFGFVHLVGAHDISNALSKIYDGYDGSTVNEYTCLRGDFEIIFDYMEQMKKAGVYDNSTIIILGDHGRPASRLISHGQLTEPITTTLMIKPENSHGRLQDNASAELSHSYFLASILEYAGIDHSKYGYSYNDIISNNISAPRMLSTPTEPAIDYEITGDAENFSNWKRK